MVDHLGGIVFAVGLVTASAVFFVHPGNDAQRAPRAETQAPQNFRSLHRHHHTCAVVDCTLAKVPGIEMPADNDNLLGMLASLQIGDDVVAGDVGQSLRREDKVHAHPTLPGEMLDEVRVFGGEGRSGNSGGCAVASMREAEVRATDGADDRGYCAESRGGLSAIRAVDNRFAIGFEGRAGKGFAFIVGNVIENNLSGNSFARQRGELRETMHNDNLGIEAISGGCGTSTERGQHNFARRVRAFPGEFGELGFFFTTHPMRNLCRLKSDFEADPL